MHSFLFFIQLCALCRADREQALAGGVIFGPTSMGHVVFLGFWLILDKVSGKTEEGAFDLD